MTTNKFREGTRWKLLGPRAVDSIWVVRDAKLCCIEDDCGGYVGDQLSIYNRIEENWEPVEDPFVIFVKQTLKEHENAEKIDL